MALKEGQHHLDPRRRYSIDLHPTSFCSCPFFRSRDAPAVGIDSCWTAHNIMAAFEKSIEAKGQYHFLTSA
jgi:hypothetical protein